MVISPNGCWQSSIEALRRQPLHFCDPTTEFDCEGLDAGEEQLEYDPVTKATALRSRTTINGFL